MFRSEKLNKLFRGCVDIGESQSDYAFIVDQIVKYSVDPSHDIIRGTLSWALDYLAEDNPMTVNQLESNIITREEVYDQLIVTTKNACLDVECQRIEREEIVNNHIGRGQRLNFRNVGDVKTLPSSLPYRDVIEDVMFDNFYVDEQKSIIGQRVDCLLDHISWRHSNDYKQFLSAYSNIRKSKIMDYRKLGREMRFKNG